MNWSWIHPEPASEYGRHAIGKRHYAACGPERQSHGRFWSLQLHVLETTDVPPSGTIGRPHQPGGGTADHEITSPKGTQ